MLWTLRDPMIFHTVRRCILKMGICVSNIEVEKIERRPGNKCFQSISQAGAHIAVKSRVVSSSDNTVTVELIGSIDGKSVDTVIKLFPDISSYTQFKTL